MAVIRGTEIGVFKALISSTPSQKLTHFEHSLKLSQSSTDTMGYRRNVFDFLILYHTTKFYRLVQIESICRRQNRCDSEFEI